ncbi:hypothetical protein D1872_229990 [compost metagenome]
MRHFVRKGRDVGRCRPAAAAGDIEPALFRKSGHLLGKRIRRLMIVSVFIRKSGIGVAADPRLGHFRERADMIPHKFRTRCAVEPNRYRF